MGVLIEKRCKTFNMNKYNSYAFDGTIDNYPYQYTKDIN